MVNHTPSRYTPEQRSERERRSRRESRRRERQAYKGTNHIAESRPPDADVTARLAEIPEDTRTPAQRMFGDPIPARFNARGLR